MTAAGSVQTILLCVPKPTQNGQSIDPCLTENGVRMQPAQLSAYVLDASQAQSIDTQFAPFDYVLAAGIWTMAFSFVVGLYLVSKSAGTILSMIRK